MIVYTANTMLHRMEAVEHIGSGIKRIRNLCREYDVDEPGIEVAEHWFTMRFPRPWEQNLQYQGNRARRRFPGISTRLFENFLPMDM